MKERELCFENDGKKIYGKVFLPEDGGDQYPMLIISHGFGSNHEGNISYGRYLAKHGIGVYIFDFCGGSLQSKSDGSTYEMSVLTEIKDLECVLKGLQACSFVDTKYMFLLGRSQGGLVSAYVAAKHPGEIQSLILYYPGFNIPDDARKMFPDADQVPEKMEILDVPVGKTYYEGAVACKPFEEIGSYQGEVLIYHGDADVVVPIANSRKAASIYSSVELVELPGQNHGFDEETHQYLMKEVKEFIHAVGE